MHKFKKTVNDHSFLGGTQKTKDQPLGGLIEGEHEDCDQRHPTIGS
jgi:hypothetical protein